MDVVDVSAEVITVGEKAPIRGIQRAFGQDVRGMGSYRDASRALVRKRLQESLERLRRWFREGGLKLSLDYVVIDVIIVMGNSGYNDKKEFSDLPLFTHWYST